MEIVARLIFFAIGAVAAWITAFRMRRRISRALGKDASDRDLTSISLWMKVEDAERKREENKKLF